MFSFEFTAGKEDYSKVYWVYYLSIRRKWILRLIIALVILVSMFLLKVMGFFTNGFGRYFPFFFFSIILIYFSQFFRIPGIKGKKAASNENLNNLFFCEINQDSFMIKNHMTEIRMKWENLFKVIDSPDLFLLFLAKNQIQFIPKNVFHSETEIETIKDLLFSKVPKVKELPKNLNYHPDFKKLNRIGILLSVLGWFSMFLTFLFFNFSG